jgi:hypothetical protein
MESVHMHTWLLPVTHVIRASSDPGGPMGCPVPKWLVAPETPATPWLALSRADHVHTILATRLEGGDHLHMGPLFPQSPARCCASLHHPPHLRPPSFMSTVMHGHTRSFVPRQACSGAQQPESGALCSACKGLFSHSATHTPPCRWLTYLHGAALKRTHITSSRSC